MLLYGIPSAKGQSRIIMSFVALQGSKATRPATPQLPAFVNFMLDVIDKFPALQHALNRNAIIDGDTYFLHAAVRGREFGEGGGYVHARGVGGGGGGELDVV